MTRRRDIEPLQKHTLHFFKGDVALIAERYPNIGASKIIRYITRKFITEKLSISEEEIKVEIDE